MLAKTTSDHLLAPHLSKASLMQLEQKLISLVDTRSQKSVGIKPSEATLAAFYHLGSGGRRIRGRLALHASLALGLSKSDAVCIASTAELLHNASLIHDDLQDKDALRHGVPAVWKKFGTNVAICTGDLMLSAAFAGLCGISDVQKIPALLALVHERTAMAISGQCADLSVSNQPVFDTETYNKIVVQKSGALLSLPLELVLIASGKSGWLGHARAAAEAFSIAYQVADDLADRACDAKAGSLNIVHILQTMGGCDDASFVASEYGLKNLDLAVVEALKLPCEAGTLLLNLSLELRSVFALRV